MTRSESDAKIDSAVAEYRAFRRRFPKSKKADLIKKIAALHQVPAAVMFRELDKKRSTSQKTAKRQKKAFKGG
jgi:hypothetical protein